MSIIKIGDYVEVTKDRTWTDEDIGKCGHVTAVDASGEDCLPYELKMDDGRELWFMDVRTVDPPATSADREALVTRAKALLAGTDHTGADIVAMAAFLAAE